MLSFNPARPVDEPPPSLCSYGPCRHYHRLGVQLDAANPRPETRGGKLIEHPKVFYTTTSHYCYPDVGIETVLGALPVLDCNRWVPKIGLLRRLTGGRRRLARAFDADFDAWRTQRERVARELEEAAGALGAPIAITVLFERHGAEARPVVVEVYGDTRLEDVVRGAVRQTEIQLEQHRYWVSLATPSLDARIDNLDATLDELGISRTVGDDVVTDVVYVHLSTLAKEPTA